MIRIPIVSEYNNKGQKQAQSGIQTLDKQIKDLGKTAVAGFATEQLFQFGKAAVLAASDLEESANAVAVTFGDATESINRLAEDAVDAYGMSTTEFNQFATQFSGFALQIAGDGGDVSQVIDDMGTRIADFASVHNLSLQEAGQKFQSAMAGSSEVVRQYGIDLSAATVEQYALEQGLAASKSEINETIKVQARYELLLQSTNKWAGDFANTSDSLANSQRRLQARLSDLQAELGTQLLPAVEETTANILFLVESVDLLSESAGAADLPITAYTEGIKLLLGPLGSVSDVVTKLRGHFDENTTAIEMQERTYWNLRYAAQQTAPEIEVIDTSMRNAAYAAQALKDDTEDLREEFEELYDLIDDRASWRNLYKDTQNALDTIQKFGLSSREADEDLDQLRRQVLDYAEALELPEQVVTELFAMIDSGDFDAFYAKVLRMEGGVTLPIQAQTIGGTGLRMDEFGNVSMTGTGATVTNSNASTININVTPGQGDPYSTGLAVADGLTAYQSNNGYIRNIFG